MVRETYLTSLIKAFFSALGTGSGVAWPLFGITFALLGASIGGPVSLALGATSIFLFLAVSIPIFYVSYVEEQKNDFRLVEQINRNQNKIHARIEEYLQYIYLQYLRESNSQSFSDYVKHIIDRDLKDTAGIKTHSSLYLLLHVISQHHELLQDLTPLNKKIKFEHLADCVINKIPRKSMSITQLMIPAFFSFVGTFGFFAGCSAGVAGLLTGLGIFTSFAAIPVLGWSILGAAVIFGSIVAFSVAKKNQENYQAQELNNELRKMHHQLKKGTVERSLNENIRQLTDTLTPSSKKEEISSKIQEKIFTVLHQDTARNSKPSLKPMSFFYSGVNELSLIEDEKNTSFPQQTAF